MQIYYQRLKEEVKDDIYREERPVLFDDFIDMVIKADNRLYEQRQEKTGGKKFNTYARFNKPNTSKRRFRSTAYRTHPRPIELNAVNREKGKTYYNYSKTRHFTNKC